MRRTIGIAMMAILGCAAASTIEAATITCPGTPAAGDREITVTTSVTSTGGVSCAASGAGNDNDIETLYPGYTLLDKSDDSSSGTNDGWLTVTGVGGLSGSFTIDAAAWAAYNSLILVFKTGTADLDPDFIGFQFTPIVDGGTWSIISGQQSLSHASLLGRRLTTPPPDVPQVPEPGSILLLGTGLAALARSARKRMRKETV